MKLRHVFAWMMLGVVTEMAIANEPLELPAEVHSAVVSLSEAGDALVDKREYAAAITKYDEALRLLPEPITEWEACTWLLVAIGDAHFLSGSYELARDAFADAMHCPGAVGNPFVHLRLGESQLELGNKDRAADELARAYMGAGADIFGVEDPKYFQFLKTVLKPPANGNW